MSLFGGLIAAVATGGIVARREGLQVLPLLDMASPGLALGIAIDRVSDLIVADHLGNPTSLPWGFRYVGADHPLQGAPPIGAVVHPVALYDLILTTVLLVVLLRFARSGDGLHRLALRPLVRSWDQLRPRSSRTPGGRGRPPGGRPPSRSCPCRGWSGP